ncbi:MAG: hypothetical protein QNJ32_03590 [Xenococcaceae cyanobacterium MO_167.B27]|nr:hypothetical protein [Xenococcaceae cyanobacterium MO_167.B27]
MRSSLGRGAKRSLIVFGLPIVNNLSLEELFDPISSPETKLKRQ